MPSRSSRSKPGPISTASRVARRCSTRFRDRGLASGCLIGTYERPDTSIRVADEEGVPAMLPGTLAT
jgi:hypothetical protein